MRNCYVQTSPWWLAQHFPDCRHHIVSIHFALYAFMKGFQDKLQSSPNIARAETNKIKRKVHLQKKKEESKYTTHASGNESIIGCKFVNPNDWFPMLNTAREKDFNDIKWENRLIKNPLHTKRVLKDIPGDHLHKRQTDWQNKAGFHWSGWCWRVLASIYYPIVRAYREHIIDSRLLDFICM